MFVCFFFLLGGGGGGGDHGMRSIPLTTGSIQVDQQIEKHHCQSTKLREKR